MLTFEQQNNLVQQGLASRKDNYIFSTFKYRPVVMYKYLWDTNSNLLECRGHTYDNTNGTLVLASPRKTFNYLESNNWKDVSLNEQVTAYRKYNGYMACATLYKGELVVSTTGTTTSEYALWARAEISKPENYSKVVKGLTSLFEIILPQDPHIVSESESGAVFLGARCNVSGAFQPSISTVVYNGALNNLLDIAKTDESEGWMVYDEQGNCCKLKTDYYVGKKKLMRMSKSRVEIMYDSTCALKLVLPKRWGFAPDRITATYRIDEWLEMTDQQRRAFLEKIE
jgi:hypothetical protein